MPTDNQDNYGYIDDNGQFLPGLRESERAGTGFAAFVKSRQGNRSVRKLIVPWEQVFPSDQQRADFVNDNPDWVPTDVRILGRTIPDPDNPDAMIRYLPYQDPDDRTLWATRIEIRGLGYRGQTDVNLDAFDASSIGPMITANLFAEAELTIYFETRRDPLGTFKDVYTGEGDSPTSETERYCIKRVRPGYQSITAKVGRFVWSDTKTAIPWPLPEIYPFQEIDVTFKDIPIELSGNILSAASFALGRVNMDPLTLPGIPPDDFPLGGGSPPSGIGTSNDEPYPPETILLRAISDEEIYFPDGSIGFDYTYHFLYRPQGWNFFPKPNGQLTRVFREKEGNNPNYVVGTDPQYYLYAEDPDLPGVDQMAQLFVPGD